MLDIELNEEQVLRFKRLHEEYNELHKRYLDVIKDVKKELIIQTGVDTSLDQYRLIYQSMTSILDECTVATKQNLLQSFPISSYFDTWGYEFLPRSCYSC